MVRRCNPYRYQYRGSDGGDSDIHMPVVKHLYVLIHGSTYCTYRLLTVTLPVGECASVG